MTSTPLRHLERPARRVRFSEGPACRVRYAMLDYPFHFVGHDKHAPPSARRLTCKSGAHKPSLARSKGWCRMSAKDLTACAIGSSPIWHNGVDMFTCPRCRQPLEKRARDGASFFACPGCGGMAVGWSVVRRQVPFAVANDLWQQARRQSRREGATCPACRRNMALVGITAATGHVFLDLCPTCYLAWFDAAEWDLVPKQPAKPEESELSPQAREAVAIAEVTRLQERDELAPDVPDQPWQWIPGVLGLPVEFSGPSLRCWPWLTWLLVALCCVIYALTFRDIPTYAQELGFIPREAFRYGGTTLLTSFFLHAGLLHLIGNMYFLLVFGDNVEDYLGRLRFLAMLMAGAAVGALFHAIGDPRSDIPCIGASAAISGVLVFYGLQFPNAQLGLLYRIWFWFYWIRFPAYFGLVVWLLLQVATAYFQTLGVTDVSALAHLGGATVGLIFWLGWRYPELFDVLLQPAGFLKSRQ